MDTFESIMPWLLFFFLILGVIFFFVIIIGIIATIKNPKPFDTDSPLTDNPLNLENQCPYCHIVAALNASGIRTVASCCGHKKMPGRIDLEDGRVLEIKQTSPNSDSITPLIITLLDYGT